MRKALQGGGGGGRLAVTDITERKRANEVLRGSEARYRLLHESMRDAFCQVDMAGRFIDSNSAYREMLGYSAEELSRLSYVDVTPAKWHEMEARFVKQQILRLGYSDVYEKEYLRKDGTVFQVPGVARPS